MAFLVFFIRRFLIVSFLVLAFLLFVCLLKDDFEESAIESSKVLKKSGSKKTFFDLNILKSRVSHDGNSIMAGDTNIHQFLKQVKKDHAKWNVHPLTDEEIQSKLFIDNYKLIEVKSSTTSCGTWLERSERALHLTK
jgi:hypothetical protein